jgi:hypothetical protein
MYFPGVLAAMWNEDDDEDVEEDATSVRLAHTTEALRGRTCLRRPLRQCTRAFIDITFFTTFFAIKNVYYTSF